MSDFFKFKNTKLKKSQEDREIDPVLVEDYDPELYIITSEKLSTYDINVLRKLLKNNYGRSVNIMVLYSFIFHAEKKEVDKSVKLFFLDYGIDLSKYIPPWSKILTLGRGLFNVTHDTDILPGHFYDYVWNKTYFFANHLKSWIFPVDNLYQIYSRQQNRVLDNWSFHFFKKQIGYITSLAFQPFRIPEPQLHLVENPSKFFEEHSNEKEVAWDLETSGLDFTSDDIGCITMSFDGINGYYLRWKDVDKEQLNDFLKNKIQILANGKFDCKFLRYRGVSNANVDFDTWTAGHALNEDRSNSLKTHAWVYDIFGGYDLDLEKYKRKHPKVKNYLEIPESVLFPYATMDAIVTYRVYKKMEEELSKDSKLEKYYYDDMMPDERMFIDIEMEGVYIDWERVEEVGNDLRRELRAIEQDIYDELGYKIDVNSSKKIGKALEEKGLPPIQRSKESVGAYYLTNEYCLTEWKKQEYHIAKLLLDYHEVNALLQTFVGSKELNNAYWGVRKGDGKLHPNFLVRKAKSHRHRCKDPNLQQVPSHGERAKMIRSFFIPPSPEYVIGKRDYSGLQLRIGAILSGDKNMKAAFQSEDDDLHSMTAIAAFHPYDMTFKEFVQVKEQAPYKEERFIGKQANFSLLFSGRPYSFCESTIRGRWSKKDCKDYMKKNSLFPITDREGEKDYHLTVASDITEKFFQLYNRLIPWHKECHKEAETAGFVRCYHGARRNLVQLLHIGKDEDFSKMSSLKNISINTRVQNYEIVIISRAMREMHKYFKENNMKSRIFVTIHDEIGFYLHKSELPHLKVKLPKLMDQYYEEYDEIPIISDGIISDPYNEKNPTYWGVSGEEW